MNNEMQTLRPWTPEEKKLHEEAMEHIQKLNEEIINVLRKQIKNDVEEYNLFRQTPFISPELFDFYRNYLLAKVEQGIKELKQLVEQNND